MVQWQNAIHLPYDIWLNVDMAWESAGNEGIMYRKSCSYMNAKLYKAFFNNSFSVTVEANDIFNKRNYGVTTFSRDITRYVCCFVKPRFIRGSQIPTLKLVPIKARIECISGKLSRVISLISPVSP